MLAAAGRRIALRTSLYERHKASSALTQDCQGDSAVRARWRGMSGDERIELHQERAIALPGIVRELLPIEWEVVEEGFDALLVQLFPISTVACLLQPIGVENLFELVLHGNGEVRLAEMQRLRDQRKTGVGHNGLGAGEVAQESIQGRFFIEDVSFFAVPTKAISDEPAAHRTQNFGQRRRGRGYVHQHVLSLRG